MRNIHIKNIIFLAMLVVGISIVYHDSGTSQDLNDSVLNELSRAKSAYESGRYVTMVELLQGIIAQLNDKLMIELQEVFPEPFAGWESSGPKGVSSEMAVMGGITMTQNFYKEDFPDFVEIEVKLKSPAAANLRLWLSNPQQMARSSEGTTLAKVAGRRCVQRWIEREQFAELMLLIGVDTVVRIRGSNVKNIGVIEKFPERMDLARLEEFFK